MKNRIAKTKYHRALSENLTPGTEFLGRRYVLGRQIHKVLAGHRWRVTKRDKGTVSLEKIVGTMCAPTHVILELV